MTTVAVLQYTTVLAPMEYTVGVLTGSPVCVTLETVAWRVTNENEIRTSHHINGGLHIDVEKLT